MQLRFKSRQFPAGNPLANALVVIAGVFVIGLSIVLGIVAFIALGSVLLVLAGIVGIRLWWMTRKHRKQFGRKGREASAGTSSSETVEVIEGEYRVVPPRDDR
jgi:hypothetical protein